MDRSIRVDPNRVELRRETVSLNSRCNNDLSRFMRVKGRVWSALASSAASTLKWLQSRPEMRENTRSTMFRRVFETTSETNLILDPDTVVIDVNQAFLTETGYARDAVVGQKISDLYAGQVVHEDWSRIFTSIRKTGFWSGEHWGQRKDGSVYPEMTRFSAIHDDRGKLSYYLRSSHNTTELRRAQRELELLAHTDALTGIPNRAQLHRRADQALARCAASNHKLAVMLIDLDNFKRINDRFGHLSGDRAIIHAANVIADTVAPGEIVARLGGDEFIVVLEDTLSADEVEALRQRLISAIAKPFAAGNITLRIAASIGVAHYPRDGSDFDVLMQKADAAMFVHKSETAARISDVEVTQAETQLAMELPDAIARGELFLEFQPQVMLDTGKVRGSEVLVRWQHPVKGRLEPAAFVAASELLGSIRALDHFVLNAACAAMAERRGDFAPCRQLAVNVSPITLADRSFPDTVADALRMHGLSTDQLILEITETAPLLFGDEASSTVDRLVELGVRLAIDDFGTGHSNLSLLQRLPVSQLKIDRSFVMDMEHDDVARKIVQAILELGQTLRVEVVAEGVETDRQERLLRDLGCKLVQGFRYARPMPLDYFEDSVQLCVGGSARVLPFEAS